MPSKRTKVDEPPPPPLDAGSATPAGPIDPTGDASGWSDEESERRMGLMRRRTPPLAPMRKHERYRPARVIVKPSHKGPVGNLRSDRHGRVDYEGHLERDFVVRMIVDPEIFELRHQPMVLAWNDDGISRKHYPDYSYRRGDTHHIAEIKPADKATDPLVVRRTAELRLRFARSGIVYELVTSEWIRREPDLSNARRLHLSIAYEPTERFVDEMHGILNARSEGLAIREIPDLLRLPPDAVYLGYAMVRNGDARLADPDSVLDDDSLIVGRIP